MNKHIKIAIAVFAAIAVLITAGVFMFNWFKQRYILDGPDMERPLCDTITACRYYIGGGMDGGAFSIDVYTGEDNKIYLSYYDCPYIGAEEESYTIEVGPMALTEIQQACYSRRLLSWGKLPKSDLELLDAPQTILTVTYGDGEMYSVSSSDEIPGEGYKIFGEIYSILNLYTQGDD